MAIVATLVVVSLPAGADVQDAGVHQPAVDALEALGVFEGTGCADGDGLCPDEPVRRWEMAVWLVRVLDDGVEPADVSMSRFGDVGAGHWWAAYTDRLAELAVTRGCATGPLRFCPDDAVTRGQMAAFLVRAFHLEAVSSAGFVDVGAANVFVYDINALAGGRITAGCSKEPWRFCPDRDVTRGEMATFLARAAGLVELPDIPAQAQPLDGQFRAVAAGGRHSCGLRTDHTIRCWGFNYYRQAEAPVGQFRALAVSSTHSCGLGTDFTVQCWGSNQYGKADPPDGQFRAVAVGWYHSCGVRTVGTVQCWGYNEADGVYSGQADAPSGQFNAVAVSGWHSCELRTDGTVQCWGYNEADGVYSGQADAPDGKFSAVTVSTFHSCGLLPDRTVQCWGDNSAGQADAPDGPLAAVTAGTNHSCGLLTDGTVQCWGSRATRTG